MKLRDIPLWRVLDGLRDILGIADSIVHLSYTPSIAILSVREIYGISSHHLPHIHAIVLEHRVDAL